MERMASDAHSYGAAARIIALDDLCRADRVSIQTKKSNYQFSVLDPSHRTGMLTGGFLGDQKVEAVFTGTVSEDNRVFDSVELTTGARAIFLVGSENHVQRLITSVITDIAIAKG